MVTGPDPIKLVARTALDSCVTVEPDDPSASTRTKFTFYIYDFYNSLNSWSYVRFTLARARYKNLFIIFSLDLRESH